MKKWMVLEMFLIGFIVLAAWNLDENPEAVGISSELGCVSPPDGLVSWWPGDGNADDFWDENHGIEMNGATYAAGIVGEAFSFDGVDDYVDVGTYFPDITDEFTIEFWVNPGSTQVEYADILGNHGGPCRGIVVQQESTRTNWYYLAYGAGADWVVSQAVKLTADVWQHVAAVKTPTQCQFYLNGSLAGCSDCNSSVQPNADLNFMIGRGYPNIDRPFNGLVDEVTLYGRALTEEEIQALYHAGSVGKCKLQTVIIDIKPGSYPNSINLGSHGNVPVAVLGSADFDATTIDPLTVTLAGAGVKIKGKGTPMYSLDDVNGDGIIDMVVHVETEALELATYNEDAVLEGMTYDGKKIKGTDSVRIVPE